MLNIYQKKRLNMWIAFSFEKDYFNKIILSGVYGQYIKILLKILCRNSMSII